MPTDKPKTFPRWFAWFSVTYFLLVGFFLTLVVSFALLSFWYLPLAIIFSITAVVWYSPSKGASLSLPIVLCFVFYLIQLKIWRWRGDMTALFLSAAITGALALCLFVLLRTKSSWKLMIVSAAIIFAALLTDRLFTNQVEVRTVTMNWRADGRGPDGEEIQLGPHGEIPVVFYEQLGEGYCYDAVFSEELKDRLKTASQKQVEVRYNIIRSFGKEDGYSIRSAAGMEFNNGRKTLIDTDGYGGTIESAVSAKTGYPSITRRCSR